MLIGLCGYKGSGKNTVGNILKTKYNFLKFSFAEPLKSTLSLIFGWDLELLEGETNESRIFRETEDEWWSKQLGFPVIPRIMMTTIGTDLLRNYIHEDIWVISLENKIRELLKYDTNIVITDYRYGNNEYDMIRKYKGIIVRVDDGNEKDYYNDIISYPFRLSEDDLNLYMGNKYPEVHSSEYSWINRPIDINIRNCYNEGVRNKNDLEYEVNSMMNKL